MFESVVSLTMRTVRLGVVFVRRTVGSSRGGSVRAPVFSERHVKKGVVKSRKAPRARDSPLIEAFALANFSRRQASCADRARLTEFQLFSNREQEELEA